MSAPKAPEGVSPTENFASFVDSMTAALEASTNAAAQFPDKSDISFHRSMDRKFGRELDSTCDRVLLLTDKLLQMSVESQNARSKTQGKGRNLPGRKLADEDDVVDNFHKTVVGPVDGLLEDADTNLDELNGQKKKAVIDVDAWAAARATKKLPGPQYEDQPWRNDESVSKPQLLFKDKVNNSANAPPWRPTLHDKPHAMVPLGFIPAADEDSPLFIPLDRTKNKPMRERLERALQHPYYYETRHLPYPTSMFTQSTPQKPKDFDDTPFEFVDTPEQLHAVVKDLLKAKEIAVDLEYHQVHSYYGFICLMQISTREKDWVIDTLTLRHELREHKLGGVLVDPSVVKVFHGADSDMVWLQQDFDIYVVNLFDTYHACKVLEFPKFSLASLLEAYCGYDADKKYQMADWRIRPIPEEMMRYARSDTHFLLYIYDNLRNALLTRSSRTPTPEVGEGDGELAKPNPQRAIRDVLNKSAETALKLYQREGYDRETGLGMNGWSNLAKKHFKKDKIDSVEGAVFKALHRFRDTLARELDESPHHVLANFALVKLAAIAPRDPDHFPKAFLAKNPLIKDRVAEICNVVTEAERASRSSGSPDSKQGNDTNPNTGPREQARPSPSQANSASGSAAKRVKMGSTVAEDLWTGLSTKEQRTTPTQSALFGQTIRDAKAHSAPQPTSMFGDRKARQTSPGFTAIQNTIHSGLAPSTATPRDHVEATSYSSEVALNPETVAFVPASERKNVSSVQTPTTFKTAVPKSTAADIPATTAVEQVVQVRKKSSDKKKGKGKSLGDSSASASGATTPISDGTSGQATVTSDVKTVNKQMAHVKAKPAIPEFSYDDVPNLLDQPRSGAQPKRNPKAKKVGKKDQGIDTSSFPKAPKNMTEVKSGSRSGTFTG